MARTDHRSLVLVVEDEESVAETYALALDEAFETRVAIGGAAALDAIDEDVDAVLLDRRMPEMHGDEVLAELRERGYDCPVIMATAVGPDLNILEMDFDDYLTKPIDNETLRETIAQHVDREPDERLDEFFELRSKLDVLESEHPEYELADSEEYQELKRRASELRGQLEAEIDDFESVVEIHEQIERGN
ncbi:response regulator [Halomicrobium mukohataei]|uniref:Response regulator n=1 Tax=Halomicrobium mukohataei TaxID=57705 RepID=A0A847UD65_9EURY|nr:response regulator [Halomicrobium mukohataei]